MNGNLEGAVKRDGSTESWDEGVSDVNIDNVSVVCGHHVAMLTVCVWPSYGHTDSAYVCCVWPSCGHVVNVCVAILTVCV